jgi:hypothetical protein
MVQINNESIGAIFTPLAAEGFQKLNVDHSHKLIRTGTLIIFIHNPIIEAPIPNWDPIGNLQSTGIFNQGGITCRLGWDSILVKPEPIVP